MSSAETETLLRLEEIQGRGRSLVSVKPLKAGQIILKDSPILLYSAFPLTANTHSLYCSHCFRRIRSQPTPCPSCSTHHFCTLTCLSSAAASSHTTWVCQSLSRLRDCAILTAHHPAERQVQARFLIEAYNLAVLSPPRWQILLSLQGQADKDSVSAAGFLHSIISSVCVPVEGWLFSVEVTAALLAKDKVNAFGLMEPFEESKGGESLVRAYGIYPKAAFFNHDCLPNACRFDDVDSGGDGNTDIVVRMIHDVPVGREVCLSYFPVNWDYSTRQKRLVEDYGFVCECDRCKVEANWSDHEDGGENGDGDDENEDEVMDEDEDEAMDAVDSENDNDFPHAYFFLRYMCNQENCSGTLAPLPPSGDNPSNLLECNVCGRIKHDEMAGAADGGQSSLLVDC